MSHVPALISTILSRTFLKYMFLKYMNQKATVLRQFRQSSRHPPKYLTSPASAMKDLVVGPNKNESAM